MYQHGYDLRSHSVLLRCLLFFIFARSRSHSPGRRDRRGHSAERRRDERNRYHPSSSSSLQRRHSKSRWIELLVLRVWVERKCHDSPYSACSLLQLTVIALIRSKNFSVGSELFVPIFFLHHIPAIMREYTLCGLCHVSIALRSECFLFFSQVPSWKRKTLHVVFKKHANYGLLCLPLFLTQSFVPVCQPDIKLWPIQVSPIKHYKTVAQGLEMSIFKVEIN